MTKTLILCVDRDDDLGKKGGTATPVIGRRKTLEAAIALGLADPEDSDTNALLAAIHLYDKELADAERGGNPVEVAAIAGHPQLGLRADRKVSAELEEVLSTVRPDEVILVSDGAEDEQILPLLQSRAKVVHVHRSVVKQAPRLEGFYYVITRLLDDEKQAKRFVLPFGIILLVWGVSYVLGVQNYAWGATLAIFGLWLLVHAMKWEERVSQFLGDIGQGIKAGKLGLLATFLMLVVIFLGAIQGLRAWQDYIPAGPTRHPQLLHAAVVLREFLPYFVSALLIRTAGGLVDAWVRAGKAGAGHWATAFGLIALGLVGTVAMDVAVGLLEGGDLLRLMTFPRTMQVVFGCLMALGVVVLHRYVRSFAPRSQAR